VTLLCVTFYSAIFPFTDLSTDFFHDKWGLPEASESGLPFLQAVFYNITHMFTTAQGTTSIIITASMLLAPFAGRLVDRVGRRALFMIVGSVLMIPAHLLMGWTSISPAFPMIILGRGVRAGSGRDVAVDPARRRRGTRRHGLRADDGDPKHRPARFPPT
jgi:MFS family permease